MDASAMNQGLACMAGVMCIVIFSMFGGQPPVRKL